MYVFFHGRSKPPKRLIQKITLIARAVPEMDLLVFSIQITFFKITSLRLDYGGLGLVW